MIERIARWFGYERIRIRIPRAPRRLVITLNGQTVFNATLKTMDRLSVVGGDPCRLHLNGPSSVIFRVVR